MKIKTGFTMVEMLAVIAVVAAITLIALPSMVFQKGTGELILAQTIAQQIETAMGLFHSRYGAEATRSWATSADRLKLLAESGALQASPDSIHRDLEGYVLKLPDTLSDQVRLTRNFEPFEQVYPAQ